MRKSVIMVRGVLLVLILAGSVAGEGLFDKVKKGNQAMAGGDYRKALEYYHDAETDLPESPELEYNMAGALHYDGGYEEAVDKYQRALNTTDINTEAQAHYNLGNTLFRMQDYQKAIQSYQQALEINPDDMDAKFNLELARRKLKEQMEQQEEDPQQKQEQQEEQQQDQEQQQQEEQEKEDQEKEQDQQQQQDQEQDQQDQQQEPQPQPQDEDEMSEEDAERILNALRDDEKEIQKKLKRRQVAGDYVGKDW
jgi:Ca-activated chloride channel family protein